MPRRRIGHEFIGHINLSSVRIERSIFSDDPIEGKNHGLAYIPAFAPAISKCDRAQDSRLSRSTPFRKRRSSANRSRTSSFCATPPKRSIRCRRRRCRPHDSACRRFRPAKAQRGDTVRQMTGSTRRRELRAVPAIAQRHRCQILWDPIRLIVETSRGICNKHSFETIEDRIYCEEWFYP